MIVHWLADVDTLEVLCQNMSEGEKYTLDVKVLNCPACIAKRELSNSATAETPAPAK